MTELLCEEIYVSLRIIVPLQQASAKGRSNLEATSKRAGKRHVELTNSSEKVSHRVLCF